MVNFEDILIPLDSAGRSGRAPDYQLEAQAHRELSKALSERPDDALQKLADTIVQLGVAQSAGISILDDADNRFHWPAIAGAWAKFLGGSMPYDASPCGVVVARNASLLFRDPQLAFPDAAVDPLIREILLSPLRVHGRTIGTVWALYHDDGRHFDAEHARLLESLAHLAGSAHWLASSLTRVAAERDRSAAQAAELARNRVELEESESRFRNMADHAPVMMWVTDVHGRCTYLNRCWYE